MKNHIFPKLLVISLLLTCGLMVSAGVHATTYQKTETDHVLFYSPDDWLSYTYDYTRDDLKRYKGTILASSASPGWYGPSRQLKSSAMQVYMYKSGGKKLKVWFTEYREKKLNEEDTEYSVKTKKSQNLFCNKRLYIVNAENASAQGKDPNITKSYFLKQGSKIYEVKISNISLTKGEDWSEALNIVRGMSIY